MRMYDLAPTNRKSFYGKAKVVVEDNGDKTLYSYNTPIIKRKKNGELVRLYDGYTQTTGTHIKAFCGLNKKQFLEIKIGK